jgi:tetratricopeptide (TPR) repeat protein
VPRNYKTPAHERWITRCVVLFFVSLIVFPVAKAYWPFEKAKYLVAAAENVLDKTEEQPDENVAAEKKEKAKKFLIEAKKIDPDINLNIDFVRVLNRIEPIPAIDVLPTLKNLPPKKRRILGKQLAESASSRRDFNGAHLILTQAFSDLESKTPVERNLLAYQAALAKKDLHIALKEIDLAISDTSEPEPSLMDTKAWVLHELHRDEEAIKLMDEALKILTDQLNSIKLTPRLKIEQKSFDAFVALPGPKTPVDNKNVDSTESSDNKSSENSSDNKNDEQPVRAPDSANVLKISDIPNKELQEIFKTFAVFVYHRAEILTSLKRNQEADQLFDWLEARGFSDFGQLF